MKETDFHVGVVGKGKMGSSLFGYLLDFDFPVVWICKKENEVEELENQIRKRWLRSFKTGLIDRDRYENRISQIRVSHLPQELMDCSLIIETITEDISLKRKLFETLDRIVNDDCIFASSSSSITPEDWYIEGERKDKVIGMHFFYPVSFSNIVELIITRNTSKQTLQTSQHFFNLVNRKFLLQEGEAAFFLNRVFLDFQAGAYQICIENSLSYKEMDDLIVRDFFPVGVFELFDRVGIDVIHFSINRYTEKVENREFYQPLLDQLEKMIKNKKLGNKSGQGFYTWKGQQIISSEKRDHKSEVDTFPGSISLRLKDWYIKAAKRFVEKGYCTKSELNYAVKEYMNCEEGPFEI
jgi:3-hydroxybutyryl-CoA dehydrogenase